MPRGDQTRIRDQQLITDQRNDLLRVQDTLVCMVIDRVLANDCRSHSVKQKRRRRNLRRRNTMLYERLLSRQTQFGCLWDPN
jgi:hypothetical protein